MLLSFNWIHRPSSSFVFAAPRFAHFIYMGSVVDSLRVNLSVRLIFCVSLLVA